jgi:putative transposase
MISNVTEAVMDEVRIWQNRPLESVYAALFMDALVVKTRENQHVINKAVHIVIGVTLTGMREVLGFWITQNEGAKFWLSVMTELKNRGVQDVFYACVDGLKGFPEAIETVFPKAQVQLCIVHMVRNSLVYVGWKERKAVAASLRKIYTSATREEAERQLEEFDKEWGGRFPHIVKSWRQNWERLVVFLSQPPEIRKLIYPENRNRNALKVPKALNCNWLKAI